MRRLVSILVLVVAAGFTALCAQTPVMVSAPKAARSRIVDTALSYIGTPYKLGGLDSSGLDCSGLVFRVYYQAVGVSLPRTASQQYDFREPIAIASLQPGDLLFFNTEGYISHVGIYEEDGKFIHAASDGPRRGVIESSLSEGYWSRTFVGAGRIIPPAEYLGLILTADLGPGFDTSTGIRGVNGAFEAAYPIFGTETGLQLRPSYDARMEDFRLPIVLSIGFEKHFRVFAGPALTLGSPSLDGKVPFTAPGGLLGTVGFEFTPFWIKAGGFEWGISGELLYNNYVNASGQDDGSQDIAAAFSAGVDLSMRWGI